MLIDSSGAKPWPEPDSRSSSLWSHRCRHPWRCSAERRPWRAFRSCCGWRIDDQTNRRSSSARSRRPANAECSSEISNACVRPWSRIGSCFADSSPPCSAEACLADRCPEIWPSALCWFGRTPDHRAPHRRRRSPNWNRYLHWNRRSRTVDGERTNHLVVCRNPMENSGKHCFQNNHKRRSKETILRDNHNRLSNPSYSIETYITFALVRLVSFHRRSRLLVAQHDDLPTRWLSRELLRSVDFSTRTSCLSYLLKRSLLGLAAIGVWLDEGEREDHRLTNHFTTRMDSIY